MNDFTKEELESLLEGVKWWLDGDCGLYYQKLIYKIESMIENYSGPSDDNIHCICKICGTWMDKNFVTHYVNPCNDGGHEWR